MPGPILSRIVSKNLLISARRAFYADASAGHKVTTSNIKDLCTLVNLAALYDSIETLGSNSELKEGEKPHIAAEYQRIENDSGLSILIGPEPKDFGGVVDEGVSLVAGPFVKAGKDTSLSKLRESLGSSLRRETENWPDHFEDFEAGREQALHGSASVGKRAELAKNFWLRSFLYVGLAKVRGTPFVPDTTRTWGMGEQHGDTIIYADELQRTIAKKYQVVTKQLVQSKSLSIPPFAASVFLRANQASPVPAERRAHLPSELRTLREKMTEIRNNLRGFQAQRTFGEYDGSLTKLMASTPENAETDIDLKVALALVELRKQWAYLPNWLLELQSLFGVIRAGASIAFGLASAASLQDIVTIIMEIPRLKSGITEVGSSEDAHAFAEVHNRLGWDLNRFRQDGINLEDIFGEIEDDEPKH
jgi:hypothetical protein